MADTLPLRPFVPVPAATPPAGPSIEPPPILVDARRAAALLGVGLRTLRSMDAAGKLPSPVRLSPGCVRWRLAELRSWTDANCPDRESWAAIRAARK